MCISTNRDGTVIFMVLKHHCTCCCTRSKHACKQGQLVLPPVSQAVYRALWLSGPRRGPGRALLERITSTALSTTPTFCTEDCMKRRSSEQNPAELDGLLPADTSWQGPLLEPLLLLLPLLLRRPEAPNTATLAAASATAHGAAAPA